MTAAETEPGDDDLLGAWRQGDEQAFETLYRRWSPPVFRFLQRQAGRELADELLQDTWLKAIRGRDGYDARQRFASWLFTLARHCMIDEFRRRSVRPVLDTDAGEDPAETLAGQEQDPAGAVAAERDQGALSRALAVLPPEQREVVLMRWEGGLTLEEIGAITGVGRETVKSRLRYAMNRLREELESHERN